MASYWAGMSEKYRKVYHMVGALMGNNHQMGNMIILQTLMALQAIAYTGESGSAGAMSMATCFVASGRVFLSHPLFVLHDTAGLASFENMARVVGDAISSVKSKIAKTKNDSDPIS